MRITYSKDRKTPKLWNIPWIMAQPVRYFKSFWKLLSEIETITLKRRLKEVKNPVYIGGLARSGTTITLEVLNSHPDTTSFLYGDMAQPFLIFLWNRYITRLFSNISYTQERPHQDGLLMGQKNPEALEEVFWMYFFKNCHDEKISNILKVKDFNYKFNVFYKNQIAKLLLVREKSRYVAKANYNITRLDYINTLFPDAKFVILIRHPLQHMISYLKQQSLLSELYRKDKRWWKIAKGLGHFEFGEKMQFINLDNDKTISSIRKLWDNNNKTEAFAVYWNSIYQYLYEKIRSDKGLRRNCIFVKYEDLCTKSDETIEKILNHCELELTSFQIQKDEFAKTLKSPTYYSAEVSKNEKEILWEIAGNTAEKFGYSRP